MPEFSFLNQNNFIWVFMGEIFIKSDLVSLHIPYNKQNHHYLDRKTIAQMKTGSLIINSSRGLIVDEPALVDALSQKHLGGAALDVFENEPYEGVLSRFENVVLTAHIGASAKACRYLMELEAAENCIRVLNGEKPLHDAILENL